MVVIEKAVLHILDLANGSTVYSDALLEVKDSVDTYLTKHIEKSWASVSKKPGRFYEDSAFQKHLDAYLAGEVDFLAFSKTVAQSLEHALSHAEEMTSVDVIFADVRIDDVRQIVLLKSDSHIGYTHQVVQDDEGTHNEIVNQATIMPSLTQRIDEFAFVDAGDKSIRVSSKKYTIDGEKIQILPEIVLECSLSPSTSDAVKALQKTAAKVAEDYGQDEVAIAAAAKNYLAGRMESADDAIDLTAAAPELFHGNPAMQEDFKEAVEDAGFTEPVPMDMSKEAMLKKVSRHRLKTDTGIELNIPTDYFDNTEYVEFNTSEDGTMSITLKHISNIINKN